MVEHRVEAADSGTRNIREGVSVLIVLEPVANAGENPGLVERVGEDIDAEGLQHFDGGYDVFSEIENYETRCCTAVAGCQAIHVSILEGMSFGLDGKCEGAKHQECIEREVSCGSCGCGGVVEFAEVFTAE